MNRLQVAAAISLLAFTVPLHAEDPRLVSRLYDPDQIVRIESRANVQTTIRFGPDELIENVAIGDSQAWQVTPNKRANLLFVKPLSEKAATNMTVVTNLHTYFFDLISNLKVETPMYELAFTYPEEVKPAAAKDADAADKPNAAELAAAEDPATIADPADLNFAWAGSGNKKLLPARIYDDGKSTFLSWPADIPVPAILVKDEKGVEGPVNYSVRGDVVVVDSVPPELILRSGREMATLENTGPVRTPAALAKLDKVKQ